MFFFKEIKKQREGKKIKQSCKLHESFNRLSSFQKSSCSLTGQPFFTLLVFYASSSLWKKSELEMEISIVDNNNGSKTHQDPFPYVGVCILSPQPLTSPMLSVSFLVSWPHVFLVNKLVNEG